MTEITKSITYLNEYKSLKKAVDEGKTPVLTVGLSAIHKANLAAALGAEQLKQAGLALEEKTARLFAPAPQLMMGKETALKTDSAFLI